MLTLRGEDIYLRALEPEDLDFLYEVENNEAFWEISATNTPFSKFILKQYLENSHRDIYDVKQLRLVICSLKNIPVGMIDLYDFDPAQKRCGLGILINKEVHRGKGYGSEAVKLLCNYGFLRLSLHQIYASVGAKNEKSQQMFEKLGFLHTGTKKDWIYKNGSYEDELLYQLINHVH